MRTPRFWSNIEVAWPPPIRSFFLKHAGKVPLRVNLLTNINWENHNGFSHWTSPTTGAQLQDLFLHSDELSTYEDLLGSDAESGLTLSAPNLRRLRLIRRGIPRIPIDMNPLTKGLSLSPETLQELVISNVDLLPALKPACTALRKLSLRAFKDLPRDLWDNFLDNASQLPQVQELCIIETGMPAGIATRALKLAHVRTLHLNYEDYYPTRHINLSGVDLPSLTMLNLQSSIDNRNRVKDICTGLCTLPCLTPQFLWFSIQSWLDIEITLASDDTDRLHNIHVTATNSEDFPSWIISFSNTMFEMVPSNFKGLMGLSMSVDAALDLEEFFLDFPPLTTFSSIPPHIEEPISPKDAIPRLRSGNPTTGLPYNSVHVYFRDSITGEVPKLNEDDILVLCGRSPWRSA